MRTRYGKAIIYSLAFLVPFVLAFVSLMSIEGKAATIASQTFVLPSSDSVTHTANTYIILWDKATGNLVADAGTIASGNTWTGGDIATAVHAQNGTAWTATIPALDNQYEYVMCIYDAASPAKTDVPTMGPFLYDPETNNVYSDTNPMRNGSIFTQNKYR